ncbi:phage protein NinX family protein [Escherichia coli]
MDYSQLSDFEINRMVGDIIFKGLWACKPETSGNNTNKWYYGNADTTFEPLNPLPDYCNDPSASWPIITENNISIILDNPSMPCATDNARDLFDDAGPNVGVAYDNPLRAAMIVFLMMQDANNA